jgi:photosystem II stability/assembly factor-like uncharacterized protein
MRGCNYSAITILSLLLALAGTAGHAQTFEWQQLSGTYGSFIPSIIATSEGTLLCASDSGVHRSSDGGVTWMPSSQGITDRGAYQLASTPLGPVVLSLRANVFYSEDDGRTWKRSTIYPDTNAFFMSMIAAGANGMVYGSGYGRETFGSDTTGLYRSLDGGKNWTRVGLGRANIACLFAGNDGTVLIGVHGFGNAILRELYRYNPDDSNGRFVSVIDAGRFEEFGSGGWLRAFARDSSGNYWLATDSSLWKSTDGGWNWEPVPDPFVETDYIAEIAVANDGTLIVGLANTQGNRVLYRSYDNGVTWSFDKGFPETLRAFSIYCRNDGRLYIGTISDGIFTWPTLVSSDVHEHEATSTLEFTVSSNPVHAQTTVTLRSAISSNATLTAYDVTGRQVATLYKGQLGVSQQHVSWNTRGLAPGIYLLVLEADRRRVSSAVAIR